MSKPYLVEYSPKSIAMLGNTKPYIDKIKPLRGFYNAYLKHPTTGEKSPGYLFQAHRKDEIQNFIDTLEEITLSNADYVTIKTDPDQSQAPPNSETIIVTPHKENTPPQDEANEIVEQAPPTPPQEEEKEKVVIETLYPPTQKKPKESGLFGGMF